MSERRFSRRDLFRVTGAAGAGLALGAGGHAVLGASAGARDGAEAGLNTRTVAFHGAHQAGIATAQQEHLHFRGTRPRYRRGLRGARSAPDLDCGGGAHDAGRDRGG